MSVSGEGTLSGSLMVGVDAAKVERSTGERRSLVFSKKAKGGYYWVDPPSARREPSAAALRLELLANGEGTRVSILKSRGGQPAVLHDLL